jgi:putative endonuclease
MSDKGSGRIGEDYAARRLLSDGFRILARNFRSRYGEIDIVASDSDYILFVEVKTRAQNALATPAQSVTVYKQRHIIAAAYAFLAANPSRLQPRFDICEVTTQSATDFRVIRYRHLKGAFDLNGGNWHD